MGKTGYGHNTWETEVLYFFEELFVLTKLEDKVVGRALAHRVAAAAGMPCLALQHLGGGEKSSSTSGQQHKNKNALQMRGHVLRKKRGEKSSLCPA